VESVNSYNEIHKTSKVGNQKLAVWSTIFENQIFAPIKVKVSHKRPSWPKGFRVG